MGWASRGKLGTDIEDDVIRQAAEGLDETSLRVLGYIYVQIDDGWQGMRDADRSEERRVGKECRSRWSPYH